MAILYTAARDLNDNRYEGAVLKKIVDHSYRIMSDIWGTADFALVWDEASQSPKQICVNVYDMNPESWRPVEIVVDATPEVKQAYQNWLEEKHYQRMLEDAEFAACQIEKGSIAKVVKGKNAKGTVGKVVVYMKAAYGMGYRSSIEPKLGIATSDVMIKKALSNGKVVDSHRDMVWVWARNCQRVDIAAVDKDALRKQAQEAAVRMING